MNDVRRGGSTEAVDPPSSATDLYCEQLPGTSFTEVTRSCCALLESPIADDSDAPPARLCNVPLTSTFLPTRDAISLLLPLSLYVLLDDEPLVAVGLGLSVGLAGVAAAPEPDVSRIKPADAELAGAPAGAPGAALGDELSAFRHPVTVIVCAALLLLFVSWPVGDWPVGGWPVGDWPPDCAPTPTASAAENTVPNIK